MELLARVAHGGAAVLAILHDLALAARYADRVLMMDRGRIVAAGPAGEVLTPETIATVFGVEAAMTETGVGKIPILSRPI
jgi:iron complex transport system ATP-binding protein